MKSFTGANRNSSARLFSDGPRIIRAKRKCCRSIRERVETETFRRKIEDALKPRILVSVLRFRLRCRRNETANI